MILQVCSHHIDTLPGKLRVLRPGRQTRLDCNSASLITSSCLYAKHSQLTLALPFWAAMLIHLQCSIQHALRPAYTLGTVRCWVG